MKLNKRKGGKDQPPFSSGKLEDTDSLNTGG